MAVIMLSALMRMNPDMAFEGTPPLFQDQDQVSSWAKDAVEKLSAIGFMNGTDKGFQPKGKVTKEQAVVLASKLLPYVDDAAGE